MSPREYIKGYTTTQISRDAWIIYIAVAPKYEISLYAKLSFYLGYTVFSSIDTLCIYRRLQKR